MDSPLIFSRTIAVRTTPSNVLKNQAKYREKNKEIHRERVRRSRLKRGEKKNREYERNLNQRTRVAALMQLGCKCARCGINDMRVLQLDHVNGGGTQENKRIHARGVAIRALENPTDFQVLCANCNWIKRWERGENKPRKE